MVNRLELRLDDETRDALEKYRIENHFEDRQDALRNILKEKFFNKEKWGFFEKLFSIFKKI